MGPSDIIALLPDSIANQIAAGEVVQRPASVIKELLENAIDAQAQQIQVILKESGKSLIQVIDDGIGMSETDARMSFERHATSKIRTTEDLFRIRTMGFRGEALASIAAVAQVELRTRRPQDELGTLLRIEGSEFKAQESVAALPGTNLLVRNLFFNVPARRNFLKSNAVEMRHILDEFQRVALAHPEVGFALYHNDAEIFNLAPGKLARRIVDIFGKNYREQLAFCQESTSYISVRGYIGKPEFARKTRGEQFFFVNERFIKHSYLHHAIISAYEGTISEGSHPFYVLFIDIDPSHIDINIHPTKTEIKFDDERSVYAIIMAAVRKAVSTYNLSPSIDFDASTAFLGPGSGTRAMPPAIQPDWAGRPKEPGAARKAGNLTHWNQLFETLQHTSQEDALQQGKLALDETLPQQATFVSHTFTMGSKANQIGSEQSSERLTDPLLFQLHNRYVLAQVKEGVMLIDQKAAYERILYERYRQMLSTRNGLCQQLLFPKTIRLSPADMTLVETTQEEIRSLGFEFDQIGSNELVIRGIPADLPSESEQDLFEELIEQVKQSYTDLKLDRPDTLARSLAKRFSARYTVRLSTAEIQPLIEKLFASSDPHHTPTGEPILVMLTSDKLSKLFKT